jgi:hypothetical protein
MRRAAGLLAALVLAGLAPEARAMSPGDFLSGVYSRYGPRPDPRLSQDEGALSADLLALYRRAETLRDRRIGLTSGLDPVEPISLCSCQDWDETAYRILRLETRPWSQGLSARLRVRLTTSDPPVTLFLRLTPEGDGWRIADLADPRPDGQPDEWLTDTLRASIAEDEAALKRGSGRKQVR